MSFIKRGDAEIVHVLKDSEHDLDDDGTRKAMDQARKLAEEKKADKKETLSENN